MLRIVRGSLPANLNGTYIKNGPAKMEFDAPGLIQKVDFKNGVATYLCKEVEVAPKPFKAFKGPWIPPAPCFLENAGNTNIIRSPKSSAQYWALYDGGAPTAIRATDLKTEGEMQSATMPGFVNAHPKRDDTFFLSTEYILGNGNVATRMRFGSEVDITYPGFIYIHDFFLTPTGSYIGFIDHKMRIDTSPFTSEGIAARLRHTAADQELILIPVRRGGAQMLYRVGLPDVPAGFVSHYLHVRETSTLSISAVFYREFMCGPAVIRNMTVDIRGARPFLTGGTREIPQWCDFPVTIGSRVYLSKIPTGGIVEYDPGSCRLRDVVGDGRFCAEIAHDPVGDYRMCYAYDIATTKTTLLIFDNTWSLRCELAFPDSTVVLPGLHGRFYGATARSMMGKSCAS